MIKNASKLFVSKINTDFQYLKKNSRIQRSASKGLKVERYERAGYVIITNLLATFQSSSSSSILPVLARGLT